MTAFVTAVRAAPGRVLALAAEQVSPAILLREAARTSRRWQTYASRLGFSSVLIGGLLLAIWTAVASPIGAADNLQGLGRGLFIGMATLQFGLALMLAPLGCASALIEETDQGTLDLLVLSRLKSHQIAAAKVLSRVLVLLTVVFGALPVMTTVVTIGGVSPFEVLAVTLHTSLAVVLAGAMGALFSLFTRSPLLAMLAAAGYAVPGFLVVPAAYAIVSMSPRAATHLSLLGGPAAQGPDAFLPLLVHLPVVWLTWRIGTRLFALRISRAHIKHAFSAELWEAQRFFVALGVVLLGSLFLLPLAVVPMWALRGTHTPFWPAVVSLQAVLYLWGAAVTWLVAWAYLRVGVDFVDAVDRTFGASRRESRPPVRVWDNPIAWREARPRAWGASAVPIQFTWMLGVLLVSQTMLWAIPGGLVGLGLFNLVAATMLTLWLATWSVESERKLGALEVLLTTTLPSWRIAVGKAAGIALPTAPLLVLALPMLVVGNVYAGAWFSTDDGALAWFGEGVAAWVWGVGVWALAVGLGMALGLHATRRRSTFALATGMLATAVGVPAAAGRLFPDIGVIAIPARLLAPPLAGDPTWWQYLLSCGALYLGAAALFALVAARLRPWAVAAAAALLVVVAAPDQARAQTEPQSNFLFEAWPLNDGVSREDRWTAVQVSITNLGGAATGELRLEERSPTGDAAVPYRRTVELAEKSRKDVMLLVKPGIAGRARTVSLTAGPRRSAVAELQWQHVDRYGVVIGVIGDDPLGLTAVGQTWIGPVPRARPAPPAPLDSTRSVRAGLLDPRLLPRHSAAYDALDQVVWHQADPSRVGARELDALLGWVASGGHLTITVTDAWRQVADSPLGEALPVDLVGTREAADLTALVGALGLSGPAEGPALQALAVPRPRPDRGAWSVVGDSGGYALWSVGTFGLGTIAVLAVDPLAEPLSRNDRVGLWRGLLWLPLPGTQPSAWRWALDGARPLTDDPDDAPSLLAALRLWEPDGYECFFNTGGMGENPDAVLIWEQAVRERLNDIPGASPVPIEWLLAFSLVYLLAIGPLDYAVLRWLGREPWTWVSFPVTVLLFSGAALIGTTYTKGSEAVVTRVEVVDVLPGTDRWRGQTWLGVFSTRKTWLRLTSGSPDGVVSLPREPGTLWEPEVITEEGPGSLRYRAETWTFARSLSTWTEPGHGRLRVVTTDEGEVLENALGVDLAEVYLAEHDPTARVQVHRVASLGPMRAGERVALGSVDWSFGPPEGEVRWAWDTLRDHPEPIGAHLHPSTWRRTVFAVAAGPVERVALTGLQPVPKDLTVFRAPLGPPVAPGRPVWSEDLP